MNFILKLPTRLQVLLLSWSTYAAALGIVLPDLLNLLAANIDTMPFVNDGYKSIIRTLALAAVLVLKALPQKSVKTVVTAERTEPDGV